MGRPAGRVPENHDPSRTVCDDIGCHNAISYVHCDVTSEKDVENAGNATVAKHGKLDIMFSNAGASGPNKDPSVLTITFKEFRSIFNINVHGAMLCARHAARVMIPEKRGSILFTASLAAVTFGGIPHVYTTSKAAKVGLTKNLCVELGQHGVRVNCISPPEVVTPLVRSAFGGVDIDSTEEVFSAATNSKGVVLKAEDMVEAALYLGSDDSRYVSGLNLVVDGGYSTTNVSLGLNMRKYFGPTN